MAMGSRLSRLSSIVELIQQFSRRCGFSKHYAFTRSIDLRELHFDDGKINLITEYSRIKREREKEGNELISTFASVELSLPILYILLIYFISNISRNNVFPRHITRWKHGVLDDTNVV